MKAWYKEDSGSIEFLTEKYSKESILWYSFLELILKDLKYKQTIFNRELNQFSFSDKVILQLEIEECVNEISELLMTLYRHVNDIDKLLECDEVECESFHLDNHLFLFRQIDDILIKFFNLKLRITDKLNKKQWS